MTTLIFFVMPEKLSCITCRTRTGFYSISNSSLLNKYAYPVAPTSCLEHMSLVFKVSLEFLSISFFPEMLDDVPSRI